MTDANTRYWIRAANTGDQAARTKVLAAWRRSHMCCETDFSVINYTNQITTPQFDWCPKCGGLDTSDRLRLAAYCGDAASRIVLDIPEHRNNIRSQLEPWLAGLSHWGRYVCVLAMHTISKMMLNPHREIEFESLAIETIAEWLKYPDYEHMVICLNTLPDIARMHSSYARIPIRIIDEGPNRYLEVWVPRFIGNTRSIKTALIEWALP